jgi:hypothetical protein
VYGTGERRSLDRNEKARFRYLVHAHTNAWNGRKRRLERSAREIADALLDFLNSGSGQCDPPKEQLAAKAKVSEKTVERRLDDMRRLGLLRWQRRIERRGWRAEQISNAYVLCPDVPEPPPLPRASFQKPILESSPGFTAKLTVAADVQQLGLPPGFAARFAAKLAEEKIRKQRGSKRPCDLAPIRPNGKAGIALITTRN